MRQVTNLVQLVGHHSETGGLLHIEVRSRDEVTRRQEVLQLLADAGLGVDELLQVLRASQSVDVKLGVAEVLLHLGLGTHEQVIELFRQDISVEVTTQHDLLVADRIQAVGIALSADDSVQLFDHEAHSLELIIEVRQVDKDEPLKEEASDLNVRHIFLNTVKNNSEPGANVGQALVLAVELVFLAVHQDHFNLVANLLVLEIALHDSLVDLRVSYFLHGLEHDVDWNEEFLLVVDKLHHAVTVGQVVDCDRLGEHVLTHAPHLYGVGREQTATVDEGWSLESDWVVSLVHNKHTHDTLVTVYDEVPSEFEAVLPLLG
mmetsp:Transcript_31722/g.48609  ORF Transcript_31722/g.48609 Transcript_31722/m.48609 type:complete len:318 (-) Transcript_31722:559-1512(-)